MGPCAVVVQADNNAATARDLVLGHGGVAHGLERKRRRAER